jgi:hypothetical protein
LWIQDSNGLGLELCANTALCLASPVVAGNAWSSLTTFGVEAPYFNAQAAAGSNRLSIALTGSYAPAIPADGNQIVFGKVRVSLNPVVAGATYMVTHPWLSTCKPIPVTIPDGATSINSVLDIVSNGTPFDAIKAPGTAIGPYISWDPAVAPLPPPGYIGDPGVAHRVVGAVCPANNVFKVTGPLPETAVLINQPLFLIQGKIYNPAILPRVPSNLAAAPISGSQVNLSWNYNNGLIGTSQFVERCLGAGCTDFTQVATLATNITSYTDNGLAAETAYSYRIKANFVNSNGVNSNTTTVTTTLGAVEQIPAAPSALNCAVASSTQVKLNWIDNASNETAQYLERCTGVSCSIFAPLATVDTDITTYTDNEAAANTSYTYRVRAHGIAGDSANSNTDTAITPPSVTATIPAAPSALARIMLSSTKVTLGWADNADNETGFLVERCKGSTCTLFSQIGSTLANITTYSSSVRSNSYYKYRIRATNAVGKSTYSNVLSVKTLP